MSVKTISKSLLILFLLEIFLGGGGRIFVIHGISFRMIIFVVMITYFISLMLIYNKRILIVDDGAILVGLLLTWFIVAALVGTMNMHRMEDIFGDLKPLLFFLLYYPINWMIKNSSFTLNQAIKLLKISALVMSLGSLGLYGFMQFIGPTQAYYLRETIYGLIQGFEVGFRPNGAVFYTGHFYVMTASLISYAAILTRKGTWLDFTNLILGVLTIFMSSTKGTIIAIVAGSAYLSVRYLYKFLIELVKKFYLIIILGVPLIYMVLLQNLDLVRRLNPFYWNQDTGINVRLIFMQEVFERIDYWFLIGKGFGSELPSKGTKHLELSYLEIFYEQGIVGLFLWIGLIIYLFACLNGTKAVNQNERFLLQGLTAGLIALVVVTAFNPIINNSIGITFMIFIICILRQKRVIERKVQP